MATANDRELSSTFPCIASPDNQPVNQVNLGGGDNGSGMQVAVVGDEETGAGGLLSGDSALPQVSGITLVLLGAGGASLHPQRRRSLTGDAATE